MLDLILRDAVLADGTGPTDIGIAAGRIAAIGPLGADAPVVDAEGCLLVPGLVETHFHLDKTCIMDRCTPSEGTVAEAVRLTSAAKRGSRRRTSTPAAPVCCDAPSAGARRGCAPMWRWIPGSA